MAEPGGQIGNTNAARGRQARQALEMAIASKGVDKEVASGMQVLYDIWKVQVSKALEGDQAATNAIMDRLDGRPGQSIEHTGQILTKERELTKKESDALNTTLNSDF